MICTPGSLAQEVGLALDAQAGEAWLTEVLREAGETPFDLIFKPRALVDRDHHLVAVGEKVKP